MKVNHIVRPVRLRLNNLIPLIRLFCKPSERPPERSSRNQVGTFLINYLDNSPNGPILKEHPQFQHLPPSLRRSIQTKPDSYQQFICLASAHPTQVLPDLLIYWQQQLPQLEDPEQKLFLKHLIFHNQWLPFWEVSLADLATLQDIEDAVDLVYDELQANHNYFGFWLALEAATEVCTNLGLFSAVLEHMLYKFSISRPEISEFLLFSAHLDQLSEEEILEFANSKKAIIDANKVYRAFFFRKISHLSGFDTLLKRITAKDLLACPGWLSFLLQQHTLAPDQLISTFLHFRSAALNDLDYSALIQSTEKIHPLFQSAAKDYKRGFLTASPIINKLVQMAADQKDLSLMETMCRMFFHRISVLQWVVVFPMLLDYSPRVVRKLVKDSEKLQAVATQVLPLLSLKQLLVFAAECSHNSVIVKMIFKHIKTNKFGDTGCFEALRRLSQTNFSAMSHIDVFQLAVQENQFTFLGPILDNVLCKTWKPSLVGRKTSKSNDDFQILYGLASKPRRQQLSRNIWLMAHSLAQAPTEGTSAALNALHHHIFSTNFKFVNSSAGKKYIFDRLVARTLHFVYSRRHSVADTQHVLAGLEFESPVGRSTLFQHMVQQNPNSAFDLLSRSQQKGSKLTKPLLDGIATGLLSSQLQPAQKLLLFRSFTAKIRSLGYTVNFSPSAAALLLHTIADNLDSVSPDQFEFAIRLAHKTKLPLLAILRFSKKVRQRA